MPFILHSDDVPVDQRTFNAESDARGVAAYTARNNRGARISIAQIIATVFEPLPDLKWDGEIATDPMTTDFGTGSVKIPHYDRNAPKQAGYPAPNYVTETTIRRK